MRSLLFLGFATMVVPATALPPPAGFPVPGEFFVVGERPAFLVLSAKAPAGRRRPWKLFAPGLRHTPWEGFFRCRELVEFVVKHARR